MGIRIAVALTILTPFFLVPTHRPVWQSFLIALTAFGAGHVVERIVARTRDGEGKRGGLSPFARLFRAAFWLLLGAGLGAGLVYLWSLRADS